MDPTHTRKTFQVYSLFIWAMIKSVSFVRTSRYIKLNQMSRRTKDSNSANQIAGQQNQSPVTAQAWNDLFYCKLATEIYLGAGEMVHGVRCQTTADLSWNPGTTL